MEFGGRTRTAATAGPRRPSDGKLGGLLRPTPTLYGEAELIESSGSHHTRCVGRISVASVGLEKARLSGRECSRHAHCVGQVKTER